MELKQCDVDVHELFVPPVLTTTGTDLNATSITACATSTREIPLLTPTSEAHCSLQQVRLHCSLQQVRLHCSHQQVRLHCSHQQVSLYSSSSHTAISVYSLTSGAYSWAKLKMVLCLHKQSEPCIIAATSLYDSRHGTIQV